MNEEDGESHWTDDDESGSFSTTLARQLQFLSDPRMQNNLTNESKFSLVDAILPHHHHHSW